MVAKTNAVPDADEDIIELTDLIAQGASQVSEAPVNIADEHLRDLKSGGQEEEG